MLKLGLRLGRKLVRQAEISPLPSSIWILAANSWNDSGEWIDSQIWND